MKLITVAVCAVVMWLAVDAIWKECGPDECAGSFGHVAGDIIDCHKVSSSWLETGPRYLENCTCTAPGYVSCLPKFYLSKMGKRN
ncbi:hypothetical protein BsWGS_08094 [Bradybaena similaris]